MTVTTGSLQPPRSELRTGQFIDGSFIESASGESFAVVNPANGDVVANVQRGGRVDVDRAVKSARRAFDDRRWAGIAPKARREIMIRIAASIAENSDELAQIMTMEMGKPIDFSRWEIEIVVRHFQFFGEALDKVYDEVAPMGDNALATITREPFGVVGAVSPWNYPLLMPVWKIAPALAAGNSVVLKPAEQSPLSILRLAQIVTEAGLPAGVLNVIPGLGPDAGQALGLHPDVDKIGFTGSTAVGKAFLRYASESNAKSVSIESGGKSPQVVLSDAGNLDRVADSVVHGIFYNSGQVCNAGSRLIVHSSIVDDLLEIVHEKSKAWIPDDPTLKGTQAGPLVEQAALEKVMDAIERAIGDGAQLVFGGERVNAESGGYFVEPTVFRTVRQDIPLVRDEIFGPVLAVSTFEDEVDALRMANDTDFGLSAAVWTRDVTKAHRFSRAMRAGTVYVNCYDAGDVSLPFGGYKQSGNGNSRDRSLHALDAYTQVKMTYLDLQE